MRSDNVGPVDSDELRIQIPAGGWVAGTVRKPVDESPRAVVVIHPATAVPERLYTAFAEFLATHGYAAVTYDYRGTGRSGSPRDHRGLRMRDWMSDDVPAVAAWARPRFGDVPQLAVGHSIGGHALALGHGSRGLAGFVTVASHAGVTATIPDRRERARVGLILRVLGPAAARVLGYVPGRRMGLGEDMPAAAMLEWSRWSRLPGYFFDDPTMDATADAARVTGDVLAIGLTDDPWATPAQIEAITDHLTAARVERRTWSPAEGGVERIGHTGFFRRGLRDTFWLQLLAWLDARAEAAPAQQDGNVSLRPRKPRR
ncbi:alpha/beta fold hydrolase [Isoptericola sp. NEAU-Y5]|uniref:Alpha/beta fold hydrolase n=1 Tax=Isoptericola luteus TaxID=2879484 RepID=A0ABS7ZK00_9MICO|nr:alpha/beta fold hydrolase [Isoptericola sp. NEAU-Y5]MCA5894847.1 alpha/beta fold hydrolase [Isoptericola sp. NEAU-Y5]